LNVRSRWNSRHTYGCSSSLGAPARKHGCKTALQTRGSCLVRRCRTTFKDIMRYDKKH
jgi:hypothetical protein